MLFCKHNSAFAQSSPAEGKGLVLTPFSYSDVAYEKKVACLSASPLRRDGVVFTVVSIVFVPFFNIYSV